VSAVARGGCFRPRDDGTEGSVALVHRPYPHVPHAAQPRGTGLRVPARTVSRAGTTRRVALRWGSAGVRGGAARPMSTRSSRTPPHSPWPASRSRAHAPPRH